MTINKYSLVSDGEQELVLPDGAVILSVLEYRGRVALYALVDPDAEPIDRYTIRIVGTGQPVEGLDGYEFLGSCILYSGSLVVHVFARLEVSE